MLELLSAGDAPNGSLVKQEHQGMAGRESGAFPELEIECRDGEF